MNNNKIKLIIIIVLIVLLIIAMIIYFTSFNRKTDTITLENISEQNDNDITINNMIIE